MHPLAAALDSFNRKERNLLVRAILAEGQLPLLSEPFRDQVAQKLGFPILETAWWATDYHIDWLAGAFALFVKGKKGALDVWENLPRKNNRRLVEGTQEDVDLVIATEGNLVFIEAKAYGYFGNAQLKHKLAHIQLLHDFYAEMVGAKPPPEHVVDFHFLITSPKEPTSGLTTCWPSWAFKGQGAPWIPLKLDRRSVFRVTRCNEAGTSSDAGDFWCVNQVASPLAAGRREGL